MAKNLLMFDLGLALSFSIIVIPALTGDNRELNPAELLHIDEGQVSWLGSLAFIMQAVGSLLSGILAAPLGRKRAMYVVNIPHLIAWIMLFYATSVTHVFIATALLGFGNGLMESPVITYIGEICEPSIRGALTVCSSISTNMGMFGTILLGSFMPWRTVAIICLFVPITTLIILLFIPETPIWLLSKHRPEEALEALRWLRGWVPAEAVAKEFKDLQRYDKQANACLSCEKKVIDCGHPPPTFVDKFRDLLRQRVLKPSIMIFIISFFAQFAGLTSMRSYMVLTLKAYAVPMDPSWATTVMGLGGLCASFILLCTIRTVGKRGAYMTSIGGSCVCCFALGVYAYFYLPTGVTSINNQLTAERMGNNNYFPLIAFIALSFFTSYGVYAVAWMMLSEVFPSKSREITAGIATFGECILMFFASKWHLDMEVALTLAGSNVFYGVISGIGFIVAYFILPETENRTLEEIELHFSDNSKSLIDINICRIDSVDCIESGAHNSGQQNADR